MLLRVVMIAIAAAGFCLAAMTLAGGRIGESERIFDRDFFDEAATATGLAEIEWLARSRGYPVSTRRGNGFSVSHYHWDGARHSSMSADAVGPRLIRVSVRTPAGDELARDLPGAAAAGGKSAPA